MRSGSLSLPTITTSILPSTDMLNGTTPGNHPAGRGEEELLCETYLENAAQVIKVLPAKKVVMVMIPTESHMV